MGLASFTRLDPVNNVGCYFGKIILIYTSRRQNTWTYWLINRRVGTFCSLALLNRYALQY